MYYSRILYSIVTPVKLNTISRLNKAKKVGVWL